MSFGESGCSRDAEIVDFPRLGLSVPRDYFQTRFKQSATQDWVGVGAMFPSMAPAAYEDWNSDALISIDVLLLRPNGTTASWQATRLAQAGLAGSIPSVRPGDPLNLDLHAPNVIDRCVVFRLQDGTAWSRCDPYEASANFEYDRQADAFEVRYSLRKKSPIAAWQADAAALAMTQRLRALFIQRHPGGGGGGGPPRSSQPAST